MVAQLKYSRLVTKHFLASLQTMFSWYLCQCVAKLYGQGAITKLYVLFFFFFMLINFSHWFFPTLWPEFWKPLLLELFYILEEQFLIHFHVYSQRCRSSKIFCIKKNRNIKRFKLSTNRFPYRMIRSVWNSLKWSKRHHHLMKILNS